MIEKLQGGLIVALWLLFCADILITTLMLLIEKDKKDNNIY